MRRRRTLFTAGLALFLAALSLSAEAQVARSPLAICTDEEGAEEILRRLDGWMSTARISSRPVAGCEEGSSYLGRFVVSEGRTVFVLRNPAGGRLRQSLPWFGETPTPLAEIDRLQRLPQFSLLLESLLAEDRLGLAAVPPPEPPKREPPRRPRPAPPKTRVEAVKEPPKEEPPEPPVEEEAAPEEVPEEEPVEEDPPLLDLRPDEEEPSPPEEPPPPRQPGIDELVPPPPAPWTWEAEAFGALRLRSPDFLAPETGLGLGYGPLALRVGFQIPTRWYLEDRPLGITSLWGSFGLRQLSRLGGAEMALTLGLTGEWLWVERLDLPRASPRGYGDAGLSLGAELRFPVLGGTMGAGAEVGGMPTARTIRLPEGGSAALGGVWGRISLRWGLGG